MQRLFAVVCLLGAACGSGEVPSAMTGGSTTERPAATGSSTTEPPAATGSSTTEPPVTTIADAPAPTFTSSSRSTDADELGVSWRPGCPVPVEDLRWVELAHWDDEGEVTAGVLIVHVEHVGDVVTVFDQLFAARFPIQSMLPITDFDGDDDASMRANNSSAFNCRVVAGTDRWSQHAFGGAIDINPLVNPWVRGDRVDPPEGAAHVARDPTVPGLIVAGDVVTEAFASIGWGWGETGSTRRTTSTSVTTVGSASRSAQYSRVSSTSRAGLFTFEVSSSTAGRCRRVDCRYWSTMLCSGP